MSNGPAAPPGDRTDGTARFRVAVVGAGIVGVSCALHLAEAGCAVTLLDPERLGLGASCGNAGALAVSEVVPLAVPGIVRSVPRWLLDPLGPLAIRWTCLPRLTPWLLRFVRASRRDRMERTVRVLAALNGRLHADYAPMLRWADAENLIVRRDGLRLYETREQFEADGYKWRLRAAAGVRFRIVDGDELRALEPAVGPQVSRGVVVEGQHHVRDLPALVRALVDALRRRGGAVAQERVVGFDTAGPRVTHLRLASRDRAAVDAVVIAAGAWSHRLSEQLGDRVPLETERGYHAMITRPGVVVSRMMGVPARGFAITPMDAGLRISGTVELASLDTPPNYARARILVQKAKAVLPGLDGRIDSVWMGHRPSLPDCLPVIDRARRFGNAIYAFGHGHMGLSWAATTGRVVADLLCDRPINLDLAPFRADRFAW